jgi:hypothetical protein
MSERALFFIAIENGIFMPSVGWVDVRPPGNSLLHPIVVVHVVVVFFLILSFDVEII